MPALKRDTVRRRRAAAAEGAPLPPKVAAATKIADKAERAEALTEVLRDAASTGAEKVAASRQLDMMDARDAAADLIGIPPPTSRPEQIIRAVRVLQALPPAHLCEALDILARRIERGRAIVFANRASGVNPMVLDRYRDRIKPQPGGKHGVDGANQRPERPASGEVAAEHGGVPELRGPAEPAGTSSDQNDPDGDGNRAPGGQVAEGGA